MKKIRIALISILAVIILGLASIMVLVASGRWEWQGLGDNEWSFFDSSTLQNTTSLDVSGMEKLKIEYDNSPFDVIFLPANDDELIIEEYFNRETSKEKMARIDESGGTVTIKQQYSIDQNINFMNNTRGYIKVYLPAEAYAALKELSVICSSGDIILPSWEGFEEGSSQLEKAQLGTSSGDMRIDFLEAEEIILSTSSGNITSGRLVGDLNIDTSSGDIKVDSMEAEKAALSTSSGGIRIISAIGDLEVYSSSGDIRVSELDGAIKVGSSSGEIAVGSFSGKGEFTSTSGDITIMLDKLQGDITAKSSSGEVQITLPGEESFHFSADSSSGSISSAPYDEQFDFNKRGTSAKGTIGNNAIYWIRINTTSGNIILR